jgi:hypothetical protein
MATKAKQKIKINRASSIKRSPCHLSNKNCENPVGCSENTTPTKNTKLRKPGVEKRN